MANLLNAVVLRPLNVSAPHRLVAVYPGIGERLLGVPIDTLTALKSHQDSFDNLCGVNRGSFAVELSGSITRRSWEGVDGNCAPTLAIRASLGRLSGREDSAATPTAAPVVVLSHRFWREAFGSDPGVLGRTLRVQNVPLTIIGVGPRGFDGINADQGPDFTIPLGTSARILGGRVQALWLVGRLRPGVTLEQARAKLKVAWPQLYAATNPPAPSQSPARAGSAEVLLVVPISRGLSGLRVRYERALYGLTGLAVLLWILACVNVSGLFLTRAVTREQEFRVQMALGASRARLVLKLAAEGFVVAFVAAGISLLLTWGLSSLLLKAVWTSSLPNTVSVVPDTWLLLLMVVVSLLTTLLVSAPPLAMLTLRRWHVLTGSTRVASRPTMRWRRSIIVAQVTVSFVLLFVASVFVQNLSRLWEIDPGYARNEVAFARLDPIPGVSQVDSAAAYLRELLTRAAGTPGVRAAGFGLSFPTAEVRHVEALTPAFRAESAPEGSEITAALDWISPGFFDAAGMALVRGQDFSWQDTAGQPDVAIVSARMAELLFPADDAVGKRLWVPTDRLVAVIGVAADATAGDPRIAGFPRVYLPILQEPRWMAGGNLIVRANDFSHVRSELHAAVGGLGRHSLSYLRTANEQTDLLLARERLLSQSSSFFAGLAVVIATLGLYGLLSYGVAQRRREIGVRVALGATPRTILTLVLSEAALIALVGVGVGIPLALGASSLARALLFEGSANNPVSLVGALAILASLVVLASLGPALRAAKLTPAEALRHE